MAEITATDPRSSQNISWRGGSPFFSFKLSVPKSDARVELFLSESSNAGIPDCSLNLGNSGMDELQKLQTSTVQDASPFLHDAYQIFFGCL